MTLEKLKWIILQYPLSYFSNLDSSAHLRQWELIDVIRWYILFHFLYQLIKKGANMSQFAYTILQEQTDFPRTEDFPLVGYRQSFCVLISIDFPKTLKIHLLKLITLFTRLEKRLITYATPGKKLTKFHFHYGLLDTDKHGWNIQMRRKLSCSTLLSCSTFLKLEWT